MFSLRKTSSVNVMFLLRRSVASAASGAILRQQAAKNNLKWNNAFRVASRVSLRPLGTL